MAEELSQASRFPTVEWYPGREKVRSLIRNGIEDAGDDVIAAIRRRTSQGRDIGGQPFEPYSEFSQNRKGVGPSPVTMIETGRLLRSIRQFRTIKGIRITPTGARNRRIGLAHQRGVPRVRLPRRQWFGLSPAQSRRIGRKHGRRIGAFIGERQGPRLEVNLTVRL